MFDFLQYQFPAKSVTVAGVQRDVERGCVSVNVHLISAPSCASVRAIAPIAIILTKTMIFYICSCIFRYLFIFVGACGIVGQVEEIWNFLE